MSNRFSAVGRSLALAVLLAATTGCITELGPGGAAPGLVLSNVSYPNHLNPGMAYEIQFERDDIEVLRPVETTSSSRWYFIFYSAGDSGYAKLMDQARAQGADGVMNVTVDTTYHNTFIFYAKVTTRLTGVAYRYRTEEERAVMRRERLAQESSAPKGS